MTGPSLAYQVVDVFTSTSFAGNPLAVVLDADDLTTEQMQRIASEFNLSETTFPTAAPEGSTYGLRIFTPTVEIPFAGHPSIGSAWVLSQLGRIAPGPNTQACGAGLLPVEVRADGATLTGGRPTCSDALDPAPLLEALGLASDDLAGPAPRWASVGLEFAFLLVRPEALSRVRLDVPRVSALGSTGVSLLAWDGAVGRCRVFPGGAGVVEDPATGSAALGLGVYLAASGLLADGTHGYVVEQGYEMGRPSTLTCTVTVTDGEATETTVSGSVVPTARGEIRVPD
ncbi:MAG: phenazine biosynthesis protein phzf family [Frankiales bacterium]|nr:phenazine biosynthesis protein phzf family [Frankiales bacterium]